MVDKSDLKHIQMIGLPKTTFKTIKERNGRNMRFYSNLIQITVRANGIIYDLDSNPIKEIDTIESMDMLQNPDEVVNTGFILSTSKPDLY